MNNTQHPKLSIIIVSYNTKDVLRDCLLSIEKAQWPFAYEIVVVDNDSKDGSQEMIKKEFPTAILIANDKNNLFAIANNQGAKVAQGDYLLLLNSDTIIEKDNIPRLVAFLESQPEDVICAGPKILNPDGTLQSEGGGVGATLWAAVVKYFNLATVLPSFIGKVILPPGTYKFNRNSPHAVSWVSGCCMLCRADLYEKVGGLNEALEFYGEEPEFGFRTRKQGYKTLYYPDAEIVHLGGVSAKRVKKKSEDSLRRYAKILDVTVGYKYGVKASRIIIWSYRLKRLLNPRQASTYQTLIDNEKKTLAYLKSLIKK